VTYTMPHARYDLILEYSMALDEHGLLRQPYSPIDEESHDDLVTLFCTTLPWVEDPAETYPGEELELFARYADFLKNRGELGPHPILTPAVVAERFYAKVRN
jgi:hypothetical protein